MMNLVRARRLQLPLLLAVILSLPASTTALSIAASDMALDPERPPEGPATSAGRAVSGVGSRWTGPMVMPQWRAWIGP